MSTIVTRSGKGAALTHTEVDANFTNLNTDKAEASTVILATEKGAVSGVCPLDATSKVSSTYLPSYVDDVLEYANYAALPATGETGKIYVTLDTNKTYRWSGSAYIYITSGAVDSVAGKTGVVTLTSSDVGLGSVSNIAQVTSVNGTAPIVSSGGLTPAISISASTTLVAGSMSAADKTKLDAISGTNTGDETLATIKTKLGITTLSGSNTGDQTLPTTLPASDVYTWAKAETKPTYTATEVGLGNANNTSDANKPISTATQTALDLKAPLASPTFTGTVSGVTKAMVGLSNVDDTTDASKPVSTAAAAALLTAVPLQTGNSGKYLSTNGTATSWTAVDALPAQTGNSGKYLTTSGTAASWAVLNVDPTTSGVAHTVQVFTSGSGTYTLPANCKAIKVTMVGGGGGGGGGGTGSWGIGGAGGNTTFGANTAIGGAAPAAPYGVGGGGGSFTLGVGSGYGIVGGAASDGSIATNGGTVGNGIGSAGGGTPFGSGGAGGAFVTSGRAAPGNTGAGGGGGAGGNAVATLYGGNGGGGAGYLMSLIASPSATYSYAIGAGGTAGAAGAGGNAQAGGAGGSGIIIVEEYYV